MSDAQQAVDNEKGRRLSDVIREVRNSFADRNDVVIEMREVARTRLEMLAAELRDVISEASRDAPIFDFAISSGEQPRLWIDAVAHVGLARDRRTYRFVRETRNGRIVLAESVEIKPVADAVTLYVAERIVERQRSLEGEAPLLAASSLPSRQTAAPIEEVRKRNRAAEVLSGLALVLLGLIVGAAITIFILRQRFPELAGLL